MTRSNAVAMMALLFLASPASAGTFQIWEDSLGAPGVTAQFPTGNGLFADIDFDADSAEGGALLFGASEIEMIPLGDVVFVDFTCELSGCTENVDYTFTPGGAGVGSILVSDPNFDSPINGIFDLGTIKFDIAALGTGQIQLAGCNYTDANVNERTCDPFTLVNVPEPGTASLLGLALAAVAVRRRR